MLTANCLLEIISQKSKYSQQEFRLYIEIFNVYGQINVLQLFKSLVRPHLEYGSDVFFPTLKKSGHARECSKACYQIGKIISREILPRLPPLEYRHLRNNMVQTYKIVRDNDIGDKGKLLTLNSDTKTRGHKYKMFKRMSRLNICEKCSVTELSLLGTINPIV